MKKQQQGLAGTVNPFFDVFNKPMPGSTYRTITAEQFKLIEEKAPAMAPWLVTDEFSQEFHIQTLLKTDCSHYYRLSAQTRSLLCRSHTDKIICPKHTAVCFACGKVICKSGNPDGRILEITPTEFRWFCLGECYDMVEQEIKTRKNKSDFLRGLLGRRY